MKAKREQQREEQYSWLGSPWHNCAYERNANDIIGYVKLLLY